MTLVTEVRPELVAVTVDGAAVSVPMGASVLDAINSAGVPITQLCKDADQKARGACRTCLVQIEGVRGFPASCTTPCNDGMRISVASPEATRIRDRVLELTDAMRDKYVSPADTSNPFFVLDLQHCILCGRCVTACDEVQHIGAISLLGRGSSMKIGTFEDQPLRESICTSCGSCFAACPTSAISPKKARPPAAKTVETTCPYCGVGCGIKLDVSASDVLVRSDDQPANASSQGMLCVKGRFGFE